jgi:hypothetical protein
MSELQKVLNQVKGVWKEKKNLYQQSPGVAYAATLGDWKLGQKNYLEMRNKNWHVLLIYGELNMIFFDKLRFFWKKKI